jgi:hypothetical protein
MVLREDVKNKIIEKINKYVNNRNITHIYGGATELTLNERMIQHKQEVERFNNLKIKPLHETTSYEVICEAETFLINYLDKQFGNILLNDRNNDGQIAQRGGAGLQRDKDNYRLYLIINKK